MSSGGQVLVSNADITEVSCFLRYMSQWRVTLFLNLCGGRNVVFR